MKYIYIYFIVFVVASIYVSADEDVLLSNTRGDCSCKDLLKRILKQVIAEQNRLINLNQEVTEVQTELKDLLNEVEGQGDHLNTIEKDLSTILVLQQALLQSLSDQQNTYTSIFKVLQELGKETDDILDDANEQSNIIDDLLTIGWQTYECNFKDFCPVP